jgi:hypothetical protein
MLIGNGVGVFSSSEQKRGDRRGYRWGNLCEEAIWDDARPAQRL